MRKFGTGLLVIGLAIAWLLLAAKPATATTWELAAEADQGLIRQYFDRDSIEWSGSEVTVISYYINQRATPQRTDYVTTYDCRVNQFKDIEINGQIAGEHWHPLIDDPLNEAIRDYLCDI
ncbi:hypothetical protein [Acaryochloris sp. IP29b_bin.137]|uniref:hypothetical protein n=1 Tax=Acaryochloris sp. IP29b_bin.137 TaxID=2969217 RepID=UPI00263103DF|nr:hypothetical protein [Acaryochloris sp. IP29b_bin.137]